MNRQQLSRGRKLSHGLLAVLFIAAGAFALADTVRRQSGGRAEPRPEPKASHATKPGKYNLKRLTPGPASAERKDVDARVGRNVRVNDQQKPYPDGLLGRSETTLAASADGRNIVVGWNDVEGFLRLPFNDILPGPSGLNGFAFSTDGGQTWTDGGAPPVIDHVISAGDPWAETGGPGSNTFFFSSLSLDDRLPPVGAAVGISVHRGHFEGGGFKWDDFRLIQSPNHPHDAYDKDVLVAAKDASGAVYLTVTNFKGVCNNTARGRGQIEAWRSHDGGDTWQGPVVVSADQTSDTDPSSPDCGKDGLLQHWATPAIGPDGELYVAWTAGPTFGDGGGSISPDARIMLARSDDGGATFGAPVPVADINSMLANAPVAYDRRLMNDIAQIAVSTTGPHRGRVYVVYYSALEPVSTPPEQQSAVSSQVYLAYSDDRGATWSAPSPVTRDLAPTGVKRFWPTVNVLPDGTVSAVFYESVENPVSDDPGAVGCTAVLIDGGMVERKGPAGSQLDVRLVESTDGGATFGEPVTVSTATTSWCTVASNMFPAFGDYIASRGVGQHLFAAWTDGRDGVPDVFFANISPGRGRTP